MDRPIIYSQAQPRSYDVLEGWRESMYAFGWLAQDVMGATPGIVTGLVATPTGPTSLTINIAQGRIYQLAQADVTAYGALSADPTIIMQQGAIAAQQVTFTTASLTVGQSQWALVQAQVTQLDDIPANDPTGGILNFFNAANALQPFVGPNGSGQALNTQRQETATVSVIYGAPATTGSEVPPQPTSGYVPLYLVDLAFGQTTISSGQIIVPGPSVGTGVPSNYPVQPQLAGLLRQHHKGTVGQAPQIDLTAEVQNKLPMANLMASSAVVGQGAGVGTLYAFAGNPNTHVAGVAATAGVSPCDFCIDVTNQVLYYCATTGNAAAATWVSVSNSSGVSALHQVVWGSTSGGSANAQTVTDSPVLGSLGTGQLILFIAGASNTGAMTLNPDTLGAKNVFKPGSSGPVALVGGEVITGNICVVVYDGTQFQLLVSIPASAIAQQRQNAWGATSAGTGNAQTVSCAPTLTSYNAGQVIEFIAGNANTTAATINADGLGAKNIFKQGQGGPVALTGGEVVAGARMFVMYDGTQFVILAGEPIVQGIGGARRNLVINNDGGSAITTLDVTADEIMLEDQFGRTARIRSFSATVNNTVSGAGGLDTGSVAANTGYYIYAGWNPSTNTQTAWCSLSSSAPTVPAGFTFWRRVGWNRTDPSAHWYLVKQVDNDAQYVVTATTNTPGMFALATGASGSGLTPVWSTVSISGLVPATAIRVRGSLRGTNTSGTIGAPNSSYGGYSSTTSPPPVAINSTNSMSVPFDWVIETTNLSYASTTGGGGSGLVGMYLIGWKDNI